MASLRRINQDDLRNHNLSVVLDTLLRTTDRPSRAELAKQTGLTKATMSLLVSLLMDDGILCEGEPVAQSAYGRPSTPLCIRGGRFCGLGLQINTDGYGVVALDLDGSIAGSEWADADMSNADAEEAFSSLDRMALELEERLGAKGYTITGSALALPGLVTDDMQLMVARNLGWEQLDLTSFDIVRRMDVQAANEANMAALAQIPGYASQRRGEGLVGPSDSFIYLSTDIGIGGAIVRDGQVIVGDHGFGGELGHMSVELRGPVCRCGRRGCLEVYAGRRAMVEAAGIASGGAAASRECLDELTERWRQGDANVVAVVDCAIEAMTSVIVSAINMCDIDTVILGGLWAHFENGLASRMERMIRPQVLGGSRTHARVLISDVNDRPALLGTAQVGLRRFVDNPLRFMKQD